MDASSPAGTINLKTRRAFDRKGRRISYNFSANLNSEQFTLDRTWGPDDREHYKARPNVSLEYSDVFLNQRLGLVAGVSRANSYTEQYRHNMTYNKSPTAADPRPMVLTALNFKDGPKFILKDTYTVTADFATSPGLHGDLEVTHLGVRVGEVGSVRLRGDHVAVSLKLDRDARVPADVGARVLRKSAIGEPYIDLTAPASSSTARTTAKLPASTRRWVSGDGGSGQPTKNPVSMAGVTPSSVVR